jgi:HEPN domain-containing protein
LPRKTESSNPADWLWLAESDLEGIRLNATHEVAYYGTQGKLAEVLEKILKAELIRLGWFLERTHDLVKLYGELEARQSPVLAQASPLVDDLNQVYFVTRYPGFDLDDPDWPALRQQVEAVTNLLELVKARIPPPPTGGKGAPR